MWRFILQNGRKIRLPESYAGLWLGPIDILFFTDYADVPRLTAGSRIFHMLIRGQPRDVGCGEQ